MSEFLRSNEADQIKEFVNDLMQNSLLRDREGLEQLLERLVVQERDQIKAVLDGLDGEISSTINDLVFNYPGLDSGIKFIIQSSVRGDASKTGITEKLKSLKAQYHGHAYEQILEDLSGDIETVFEIAYFYSLVDGSGLPYDLKSQIKKEIVTVYKAGNNAGTSTPPPYLLYL